MPSDSFALSFASSVAIEQAVTASWALGCVFRTAVIFLASLRTDS